LHQRDSTVIPVPVVPPSRCAHIPEYAIVNPSYCLLLWVTILCYHKRGFGIFLLQGTSIAMCKMLYNTINNPVFVCLFVSKTCKRFATSVNLMLVQKTLEHNKRIAYIVIANSTSRWRIPTACPSRLTRKRRTFYPSSSATLKYPVFLTTGYLRFSCNRDWLGTNTIWWRGLPTFPGHPRAVVCFGYVV
jgi:hypothetical protein